MKPSARIAAVIELLETLYQTWQDNRQMPMDAMMAHYFKERRYIGSKDRAFIGEMTYGILRHGGSLEWHLEQKKHDVSPRSIVLAGLMFFYGQTPDAIAELFSGEQYGPEELSHSEEKLVATLANEEFENEMMPIAARHSFPDWMEGRLRDAFGKEIETALEALNTEAPVDLRTNTLKCKDRADLIFALDKEGFTAMPTPHSPIGVRLKKRIPAFTTQAFRDGWFEMQDEGSQIAALLVQAQKGDKVIDFCAGAGGKTLAIAATMGNKGRIIAFDNAPKRLKQMPKRLARAGVDNVMLKDIKNENDPLVKRHRDSADWVLVDAPCSGSGTWRRNPDLKWRMTPNDLLELKAIQRRILVSASSLVKKGGKLVYVTCSVFPDENANQVSQFIMDYPDFKVAHPGKLWNSLCRPLNDDPNQVVIQLAPHQDGTDGFFATVFERRA